MTEPWYKDGLRFGCTQCGQCCTGSPGYVWIDEKEIVEMAQFLKIDPADFVRLYTRRIGDRISLLEHPKTYDCVFLKERMCKVYGARPKQCRAFPWWPENIRSKEDWEETAQRCEGVNHPDAPLITLSQIREKLEES